MRERVPVLERARRRRMRTDRDRLRTAMPSEGTVPKERRRKERRVPKFPRSERRRMVMPRRLELRRMAKGRLRTGKRRKERTEEPLQNRSLPVRRKPGMENRFCGARGACRTSEPGCRKPPRTGKIASARRRTGCFPVRARTGWPEPLRDPGPRRTGSLTICSAGFRRFLGCCS